VFHLLLCSCVCVCVCVGFVCLIKINQSNWVGMDQQFVNASWLHCALAVAQYVVIGPVFVCVCVCVGLLPR